MSVLLKHQPWNSDPSQEERDGEVEWNMWRLRQPPFHDLAVGNHVVLVCGGGPANGKLTWEVEVVALAKGQYSSHGQAWNVLRAELGGQLNKIGVTRRDFLANEYTKNAPAAGWLLGWAYRPVRLIMAPRPAELRFRPNGWARVDSICIGRDAPSDN